MAEKPTYIELERKIKKLESEALKYLCREREFDADRKLVDYGHLRRTISLMKINDELNREINETKSADKEEREIEKRLFLEEEKSSIGAIVNSISGMSERERAEVGIRKCRKQIEELIKQTR